MTVFLGRYLASVSVDVPTSTPVVGRHRVFRMLCRQLGERKPPSYLLPVYSSYVLLPTSGSLPPTHCSLLGALKLLLPLTPCFLPYYF